MQPLVISEDMHTQVFNSIWNLISEPPARLTTLKAEVTWYNVSEL
jgi:hypothetical protein